MINNYEGNAMQYEPQLDEDEQQRQAEMDEAWAQYEAQQQSSAENGFAR